MSSANWLFGRGLARINYLWRRVVGALPWRHSPTGDLRLADVVWEAVAELARDGAEELPAGPPGYEIVRLLGEGGMGTVYEARDTRRDRAAALKVYQNRRYRERFEREAKTLSEVSHPNIAEFYEVTTMPSGAPCLVMEYVAGTPIDRYCKDLDLRARLRLFLDLCSAVSHLHTGHEDPILHRDLKRSNILVTDAGVVKVLDFGIVKVLSDAATALTCTGNRWLSFEAASPEQYRNQDHTTASDTYALGLLLYRLVAGMPAYEVHGGLSATQVERLICTARPLLPSTRCRKPHTENVRGKLDSIVMKAVQKSPKRRYHSANALGDDISRYLDGDAIDAPSALLYAVRRRLVVGAAPVFLLLVLWAVVSRLGGEDITFAAVEPVILPGAHFSLPGERIIVKPAKSAGDLNPHLRLYHERPGEAVDESLLVLTQEASRPTLQGVFPDYQLKTYTKWLGLIDTDGKDGKEVIWIENGTNFFPSWISWFDPTTKRARRVFAHSGNLDAALVYDQDGDGDDELLVFGVNNRLGYASILAVLDWERDEEGVPGMHFSPDLLHREQHYPEGDALRYVTLGLRRRSKTLSANQTTISVAGWSLDSDANPESTDTYGKGPEPRRRFWSDLAQLWYRLGSGREQPTLIEEFKAAHPLILDEPGSRAAATIHLARRLASLESNQDTNRTLALKLLRDAIERDEIGIPDLRFMLGNLLLIDAATLTDGAGQRRAEAADCLFDYLEMPQRVRPPYGAPLMLAMHGILHGDDDLLERALNQRKGEYLESEQSVFVRGVRTFDDFCKQRPSSLLDRENETEYLTPWNGVLRLWTAVDEGIVDAEEAIREAERLEAEDPAAADVATLLKAWVALHKQDSPRGTLRTVQPVLHDLKEKAQTSYGQHAWASLASSIAGHSLVESRNPTGAVPHLARAAALAPSCWWGKEAAALLRE